MEHLVLGTFTPSVLLDIARATGRLADADLDVTEVPVASSAKQFKSLVERDLDAVLTSPDNVLAYRFDPGNRLGRLVDARIVSAIDRGLGLGLYVAPDCTADVLRTGRVGVDVPDSGFALALYALAEEFGVRREDMDVVALGSTPKRLGALLNAECRATMLNAGNELKAEAAGCRCVARVSERLSPYLGTVLAVEGESRLPRVRDLSRVLVATIDDVLAGELSTEAADSASRVLGLTGDLPARYVDRLRNPSEGLVGGGVLDARSLNTLIQLRKRYLPSSVQDASDALASSSGLVA
ncbi:hypothetical protein ACIQI8_26505 [Streptomyces sp. NPDC092369]|uniref:hypothetical protein n=1 Tax=Streptomyces sp. NPDC092369 TaxID=3366015 RepID=UPI00381A55AA